MWYKIAKQNIGGGVKFAPILPVSSGGDPFVEDETGPLRHTGYEKYNSEFLFILDKMGHTLDDYYKLSKAAQEEIWNLLVYRPHHFGGSQGPDESGSGVYGDQMMSNMHRLQSPLHPNPGKTSMEVALGASRTNEDDLERNMLTLEKTQGDMLVRGIPQYNSGKIVEREDVPSSIRWV